MAVAILSPHLDDAVLSCWHVLTQPGEVVVINVFAGAPEGRDTVAWWDRYTGATDSRDRVRERAKEDRTALSLAGRTAVNLDLLDEQYRDAEQPLAPVTAELERFVSPGGRIYAPAGLANHGDHALVRTAALELRTKGFVVSLYAARLAGLGDTETCSAFERPSRSDVGTLAVGDRHPAGGDGTHGARARSERPRSEDGSGARVSHATRGTGRARREEATASGAARLRGGVGARERAYGFAHSRRERRRGSSLTWAAMRSTIAPAAA